MQGKRRRLLSVATVAGLAVLAQFAVHGEQARACGWSPSFAETSVFDQHVLGDRDAALAFDPWSADYGETCFTCAPSAKKPSPSTS